MSQLEIYEQKFARLHCDRSGGRPRPHKAVMLLAVSLLAEADELIENRIEYNSRLLEVFRSLFDDVDLIDAAHLIPFNISKDDRPQNGIALCKNHHWLMDHGVIAPGPGRGRDYQHPIWHVRPGLDDRFEEHRPVLELKNKTVILPAQPRYAPTKEAIDWRVGHLRADRI